MTSWRKAVEDYVDLRRSLGFKLLEAKVGLIKLRLVSETAPRSTHHHCAGDGMGTAGQDCAPRGMGKAAHFRPRLCSPLERP